eukprot:evm.model.scf_757EXC.3 EVM.evm.TU.scf_757EXC.3   scf_757EXC:19792-20847(-)
MAVGAGRRPGSHAFAALLLLLALPCSLSQTDVDASGGAPAGLATAFVGSAVELQAALSPQGARDADAINIEGDIFADPLSFLPTLTVGRPLSICGTNRGLTLSAVEEFAVVAVNASVRWCDMTFDLTFKNVGADSRLESMMFEVGRGGSLVYESVDFYVGRALFSRLLADLEVARGAGNGTGDVRAVSGKDEVVIEFVELGRAVLRDVVVRVEETPLRDPTERQRANSTRGVSKLTGAKQINTDPLDVTLEHNFTVTKCLLDAIAKGTPIPVRRPLTLSPLSFWGSWLVFKDAEGLPGRQVPGSLRRGQHREPRPEPSAFRRGREERHPLLALQVPDRHCQRDQPVGGRCP